MVLQVGFYAQKLEQSITDHEAMLTERVAHVEGVREAAKTKDQALVK